MRGKICMIREMRESDFDQVMDVWLRSNIFAHDFVSEDYWIDNQDNVREHMKEADLRVIEDEGVLVGFLGMLEDYIAGIFIDPNIKSKGYGKQLIDDVKKSHRVLALDVYEKNTNALNFYLRNGFKIVNKSRCEDTGNVEVRMKWMSL